MKQLDIMGVCNTPWSSKCTLEGNKFWFYSLSISIFGGLWDLYLLLSNNDTTPQPNLQQDPHGSDLSAKPVENSQVIVEQPGKNKNKGKFKTEILLKIIENAADIFQPGAGTGWIVSDRGIVVNQPQPQPQPPPPPSFKMEVPIDTALLFKQIKEKVTRDGDDQGEVTEELFESELKVLRKRLRLKKPEDIPSEHELRTANSICAYFWHKNGIKKAHELFPDAFAPRSTRKASEVKNEKVEEKPIAGPAATPIVSGTLIAGIPLHDWLALKQGDPETAKELMDNWKAEQAEKKAEQAALKAAASAEEKTEDTRAKRKSAVKKEENSDSDIDLSSMNDIGKKKAISAVYRGGVNVNAVAFGDPNPFGLLAKKESKEELEKGLEKEGPSSPAEAESEETSKTITEGGEDAGGDTVD
ncbi:hypothetical protein BHYA_0206g00050 [Botrytis hyacinthi]|uniref:Uncharacterized protein n=1 Tax=Botrytis hyacinthi TaxID=278943 RepID=A0A4Z1GBB4_9HELO|nr:hypothetical protein BHYA_0206g00050 [Botrytis hyacinthi]